MVFCDSEKSHLRYSDKVFLQLQINVKPLITQVIIVNSPTIIKQLLSSQSQFLTFVNKLSNIKQDRTTGSNTIRSKFLGISAPAQCKS